MRRGSVFIMLIVAAVLVCLAAPAAQAVATPQPAKAWTVMVYMDGDNNLEDYVVKDIETELSALGSNASVLRLLPAVARQPADRLGRVPGRLLPVTR